MRIFSKIIIPIILVTLFFGLVPKSAQAGVSPVSGWAWSDNIGWISFSNSSDGSPIDYGVNIDIAGGSGRLSGYAWSDNIGWISFNESELSGCPQAPCRAEISSSEQIGKSNVSVKGWARALAHGGGWDGWIKFDHGQAGEAYIDTEGYWRGWAWGDVVVGWVTLDGVVISGVGDLPVADNLSGGAGDWCIVSPAYYFSWNYSDSLGRNQSRFRFQVYDNPDFAGLPVIDRDEELIGGSPGTNNQQVGVAESPGSGQLGYGATYHWRVKVWNSEDEESEWSVGPAVIMPAHRWPTIIMSWSPALPDVDENINFLDESVTYGGATVKKRDWTFEDGKSDSPSSPTPVVRFPTAGFKEVTLTVEDSDGYVCTGIETIIVGKDVPFWKEILPW